MNPGTMNRAILIACAALGLGSFGCSNTVRYMTATHWLSPQGSGQASAPTEAGKETTQAASPSPEAGKKRVLYVTYWEGSCSGGALGIGRGCSKGDSRVKRCDVQPDNSLVCAEEKEMDKTLSTSN